MVGVAQLVEHLNVAQEVAGSSPVTHPIVLFLRIKKPVQKRTGFFIRQEH